MGRIYLEMNGAADIVGQSPWGHLYLVHRTEADPYWDGDVISFRQRSLYPGPNSRDDIRLLDSDDAYPLIPNPDYIEGESGPDIPPAIYSIYHHVRIDITNYLPNISWSKLSDAADKLNNVYE